MSDLIRTIVDLERSGREPAPEAGSHLLPFVSRDVVMPFTANNFPFIGHWPRACLLRRLTAGVNVITTNNGSNYWVIDLVNVGVTTVYATLSTAAIAANTWVQLTSAVLSAQVALSELPLNIRITKTGAPGSLYLAPAVSVI